MTHEEEMKQLRAETERLRKENDQWVAKISNQLNAINNRIRGRE